MIENQKRFAERLSRLLAERRMSHHDLAEKVGVSQPAVSAWVRGDSLPRASKFAALAQALGTDEAWLLSGSGEEPGLAQRVRDTLSRLRWVFRPTPVDEGRDRGNPNRFVFMPRLRDFVREALQNVLDASIVSQVEAVFRIQVLRGEELSEFLTNIRWQEDLLPHLEENARERDKVGRALADGLAHWRRTGELVLLSVEDRGGAGLVGQEHGEGNFAALVRNNLDSHKTTTSGGAFGLGKAVYWRFSRFGLVLFHSLLSGADEAGRRFRLIGKAELGWHQVDGQGFAGPGWFGEVEEVRSPGNQVVGTRATSLWDQEPVGAELYMPREDDLTGTSIMIVGFHDPSGELERPDELANAIAEAAALHFWPAIVAGKLNVRVEVEDGQNSLSIPVDVARYQPEFASLYQAYLAGAREQTLGSGVGDIAVAAVNLAVPQRTVADAMRHEAISHEAVLIVRRADPSVASDLQSRVAFFRGPGMVVTYQDQRNVAAGAVPFHACVLAGEAVVGGGTESIAADLFLRTAEPPAHNQWTATQELRTDYARGARTSLENFFADVRRALANVVGQADADEEEGPQALKQLLRLSGETLAPARPVVKTAAGNVQDGAWRVRAKIRVGSSRSIWTGEPTLVFAGDTGGAAVPWLTLTSEDPRVAVIDNRTIRIPPGIAEIWVEGMTDPAQQPVPASDSAVVLEFRNARREAVA